MIDFDNADYLKLRRVDNQDFSAIVSPLLIAGEDILSSYRGIRDGVVFTNKRIIAINVQGVTGKKKDLSSLPYSKIQVYSIETAGTLDLDNELVLWFSGVGQVRFEFTSKSNITEISRYISEYLL